MFNDSRWIPTVEGLVHFRAATNDNLMALVHLQIEFKSVSWCEKRNIL